jgi:predicted MPP superfamily phosphohydrolase
VSRTKSRARQTAETAGLVSFAALNGAAEGAVISNEAFGAHVQYMDGVDATVRISQHPGLHVDTLLTPIASHTFQIPIGPFHLGINVDNVHFNPPSVTGRAAEHAASLLSQFDTAIVGQTQEQLTENLLHNAKLGAAAGAVICYAGIRAVRFMRARHGRIDANLDAIAEKLQPEAANAISKELNELGNDTGAARRRERKRYKINRRLGMAAVAPLLVVATAISGHEVGAFNAGQTAEYDQQNLPACFTGQHPTTRDITVSGAGGDAVNLALYASCQYPKQVRSAVRADDDNFKVAFSKYKTKRPEWFSANGNIVRIVHLSDFHCNQADAKYLLADELQAADPDVIMNTGDTQTNSGHMPMYEKKCIPEFIRAVTKAAKGNQHPIDVYSALGNHDAKKITTLDSKWVKYRTLSSKHPVEKVELDHTGTSESSIKLVSIEDPENVIWSPPPETVKTDAALLVQAKKIAAIACKVKAQNGVAPWVLAHREQALSAVIADDCASVALSGHTHEEGGVKEIVGPHGNDVLQNTAASVSGADIGFTLYQEPQQDASFTEFFFDKTSQEIVGYVTPTVHLDESVSVHEGKMPEQPLPWQNEPKIAPFIKELVK